MLLVDTWTEDLGRLLKAFRAHIACMQKAPAYKDLGQEPGCVHAVGQQLQPAHGSTLGS